VTATAGASPVCGDTVKARSHPTSVITQLRDDHGGRPYALAERLAEAGIEDLHQHFDAGRSVREYLASLRAAELTPG
jgi:hypothetical protein